MLAKLCRTVVHDSLRVLQVATTTCKPLYYRGALSHFCTKNEKSQSEHDKEKEPSAEESSGVEFNDREIFEAFDQELNMDDSTERKETFKEEKHRESIHAKASEDGLRRPWSRKERVKACLAKLERGPDGRYTNVFEVATEVDMLIASYVELRAKENPSLVQDSDDEEKLLEGIDIEKFKRLQKRLRSGTYKFQPVVEVPLPKPKVVKRKKKK